MKLNPPRKLESTDELNKFDCGQNLLNHWLKKRALQNSISGGTQTSVITNQDGRVIAYFSLIMGDVRIEDANEHLSRNLANYPIAIMKITRMAVDLEFQGQGIGQGIIKHIMQKAIEISQVVGCRAIVVDPIDDKAAKFYESMQFRFNLAANSFMYIAIQDIAENL